MRLLAAAVDAHCALADEVKRLASGEAPPATDDELAVAVRGLLVDVCGLQDQHWSRSELASEVTAITEARGAEASAVRRLAKGKAEALPVEVWKCVHVCGCACCHIHSILTSQQKAGSSDSALPPRTPMTRAMSKKVGSMSMA